MHRLHKVTLPNNHPLSKCWHPNYHLSPFQEQSAKVCEKWYRRRFTDEGSLVARAVPLCIFGGAQSVPYVLNEHADGIYTVCRSCVTVIMCCYDSRTGLSPRKCEGCGIKLELNDYFQPVGEGSRTSEADLVDPEKDPAVTIAETCALSAEGIPLASLGAVIAVLHKEGFLKTGEFIVESLEILRGGRITS